jgi:hypothetical protein
MKKQQLLSHALLWNLHGRICNCGPCIFKNEWPARPKKELKATWMWFGIANCKQHPQSKQVAGRVKSCWPK